MAFNNVYNCLKSTGRISKFALELRKLQDQKFLQSNKKT